MSSAALLAQAAIDVRQGTVGLEIFSSEWFAQAWQIGLITPFIILAVAIAARYLAAGAYFRSGIIYLAVVGGMWVTVTNGADFLANTGLAEVAEENAKAVESKDIADIKNKHALDERKEMTDNLWRTYTNAKTPAEKEKILGQIREATKDAPVLVTPEKHVARAGSGGIWNKWLGWRPEAIQEFKAVAVPVLIMFFKTIGLTVGFANWPMGGQLPEPAPRARSKWFVKYVSRFTYDDARSDIKHLAATGALTQSELTGADFARRWAVSRPTAAEWIRHLVGEKLVLLERAGRGNRLLVRPGPALSSIPHG